MKHSMTKLCVVAHLLGLLMLSACSGAPLSGTGSSVESAMNSNLIAVPPYTRTIFSSNNF